MYNNIVALRFILSMHNSVLKYLRKVRIALFSCCQVFPLLILLSLLLAMYKPCPAQNRITVEGTVVNDKNSPIPFANVTIKGTDHGVPCNAEGHYRVYAAPSDSLVLVFSAIGYTPTEYTLKITGALKYSANVTLQTAVSHLEEVAVLSTQRHFGSIERISPKDIQFIPDVSGSFESILKTLPGVSSSNEMSSQYSVRGGNFDENLVYVNDVEIYRSFLIRSGQQEGLSFINSDMVEGIDFSAGGFSAEYGDKMSSVLSIKYRQPFKNAARADVSLLGFNGLVEGVGKNGKFTHITGVRYKTSQYMLSSLDVGGEYNPSFIDFQSNLTWRFSSSFLLSFLGNYSSNKYQFIPTVRETRFGSFTNALQLKVFYEGQEVNHFETAQGALSADFRPSDDVLLKLIASSFRAREAETFDVIGQYLLNELDNSLGSSTYGDSSINVGIGGFINHARNYLDANFYRIEHLGTYSLDGNTLRWGLRHQMEEIRDRINEWDLIDSSGYSVPYNGNDLISAYHLRSSNNIFSHRLSGFVQDVYKFSVNKWEITANAGIRLLHWSFNNETNISPRASIMLKPNWKRNIAFHLSGGSYHQPPMYKELRYPDGSINPNIKSQKSIHTVLGMEYQFMAWERPFRFQTEVYYKYFSDLIPYKIDNVRILYVGENLAKGYAQGIDFKVNGEFVKGSESWASLSLMQTYEDVENDSYVDRNGVTHYPGYYPRPTDQRVSIGLFFQDYIPGNPTFRVHLSGFFGTGLPFSPPNSTRYDVYARMPAYKRVDIGFTKVLRDNNGNGGTLHRKYPWLKSLWIGAEVFNLFDFKNTISYLWVQTVSNQSNQSGQYAVPNYLTSRRVNIKISANF